jgi:hypothetical protein
MVGLAGCVSQFDMEYTEVEHWHQAAADAGYEWLETGDLLEQAREAHEAGDFELAFALLEKAGFQAEAALTQAEREAGTWQDRVIR